MCEEGAAGVTRDDGGSARPKTRTPHEDVGKSIYKCWFNGDTIDMMEDSWDINRVLAYTLR